MSSSLSGLARLERDVLDDSVALASLLRQVLIMGGRASSEPLRTWARRELKGYTDAMNELPDYRKISVQLKADVIAGPKQFTGQEIGPQDLPESVRNDVKEEIGMTWGISEIQATAAGSKDGKHIRLGMPGMAYVARLMTKDQQELQHNPFLTVTSVYWSVSTAALEGVLDQVRTQLTEFVAELRATMPPGDEEPTSEQVRRAVSSIQITVGDNSPVTVAAPVAYAERDAIAIGTADMS
ncbi:hypothetical protein ACFYT4_33230 [Streptomyces sp. NPDC004609]|uniref:AbiTii domain-containing protein n=1 Tax=Streptomyces sp. NPDC004609 TaxID=3364704 RepID=UPI0036AE1BCF